MSYDLNFWRLKENVTLDNQETYERLSDGEHVEGLEDLPILDITRRVSEVFEPKGWERLDDSTWDSNAGTFQIFTTPQFFRVDCYDMNEDDMNCLIDIASEFSCPLFDPQVGERFDGNQS